MGISFFAKRYFFYEKGQHLIRGSSLIRGQQIAEYLGAKYNPTTEYENDLCIYVKPDITGLWDSQKLAEHAYIDIVDDISLTAYARKNSDVPFIVCSQIDYHNLSRKLSNKIVFIPQHHCNFDRIKRSRKQVKTIGIIGSNKKSFGRLPNGFKKRLAQKGLEFLTFSSFHNRQDVVDFYKKIDVQVVWRPWAKKLSNPLKIVNAAAFGVPTIALDESAFQEMAGCYLPAKSLDDFMDQLESLWSSPKLYDTYSKKCLHKAEDYHISKIAEKYKQLAIP